MDHVKRQKKINDTIFYGLSETEQPSRESELQKTIIIFSTILNTRLKPYDIQDVYRIGVTREGKHRPVVLKLTSTQIKHEVFRIAKHFKKYFRRSDETEEAAITVPDSRKKKENCLSQTKQYHYRK
ncbi:hypothetical protein JTB14_035466 [Gonioctena quinquepunctata]|nr:hypothetical protein JTB14_035466 [Gonioctena quinquepunctata]